MQEKEAFIDFAIETDALGENPEIKKEKHYILNFVFCFSVMTLALIIKDYLHPFVSMVGSFVGVFEIIIFPYYMIWILNKHNNILNKKEFVAYSIVSVIFILLGIASFYTTLITFGEED